MVKTTEQLHDETPIIEVDDYAHARAMVAELHCTDTHLQMYYLALWVARLREYYVQLGRDVEAAEGPPRRCHQCKDAAACRRFGECTFTGFPLRKTA